MADSRYAASVRCLNLGRLEDELAAVEAAGFDELHFDLADGRFTNDLGLGFDLLRAVKAASSLPITAHLMVSGPGPYIDRLAEAGCNTVCIHAETCVHPHRALTQIRDAGALPGLAVLAATPLTKLDYLLPLAGQVLLQTGEHGGKMAPSAFERARILHENIRYNEYAAHIAVEGCQETAGAAKFAVLGVALFVLDDKNFFKTAGADFTALLAAFKADIARLKNTV